MKTSAYVMLATLCGVIGLALLLPVDPVYQHRYQKGDVACWRATGARVLVVHTQVYASLLEVRFPSGYSTMVYDWELEDCE